MIRIFEDEFKNKVIENMSTKDQGTVRKMKISVESVKLKDLSLTPRMLLKCKMKNIIYDVN